MSRSSCASSSTLGRVVAAVDSDGAMWFYRVVPF
jgi:hypothetical protein